MVIQMIVIMLLEMTLMMIMTKNGGTCSKCDNIFKTESDLTLHIEMQYDDDNDKLGEDKLSSSALVVDVINLLSLKVTQLFTHEWIII